MFGIPHTLNFTNKCPCRFYFDSFENVLKIIFQSKKFFFGIPFHQVAII